jgi:hypothetical protein
MTHGALMADWVVPRGTMFWVFKFFMESMGIKPQTSPPWWRSLEKASQLTRHPLVLVMYMNSYIFKVANSYILGKSGLGLSPSPRFLYAPHVTLFQMEYMHGVFQTVTSPQA